MGLEPTPPGAAAAPGIRTGRPAWQTRLLRVVSTRWAIQIWYAGIVGFFLILVLLPALYVLGYVVGFWPSMQAVLGDPTKAGLIPPALELSFGVALTVAALDLVAGLPLAWLIVRHDFRGKSWFNTIVDSPLAVTTGGLGFSVVLFWGATSGITQYPPGALGLTANPFLILVLLHLTTTFPYMVRSLAAILEEIDIEYENAARTAGASRLTAARTITLPMFRSGMATGLLLVLAKALSDTGGAFTALTLINSPVMNGTGLIQTWKTAAKNASDPVIAAQFNAGLALVSALMIAVSLVLLVFVKYLAVRFKIPLKRVWPRTEKRLSRGKFPAARNTGAIGFLVFFILIPSFFFLTFLFVATPTQGFDWDRFWSAVGVSFLIGSVATAVDLATGVPMAILITRGRFRGLSKVLDALVNVPYIVPSAALGISLMLFWSAQKALVPSEIVLVTLAHVAFTFPFVVRNVVGALEQLDPATEETARTLGAKPVQVFRRVLFPAIRPAILAGSIMAFTRSLGETGATLAVSTEVKTIPILIVDWLTNIDPLKRDYYGAALAQLALLAVSFAAILGLRLVVERRRRRG